MQLKLGAWEIEKNKMKNEQKKKQYKMIYKKDLKLKNEMNK